MALCVENSAHTRLTNHQEEARVCTLCKGGLDNTTKLDSAQDIDTYINYGPAQARLFIRSRTVGMAAKVAIKRCAGGEKGRYLGSVLTHPALHFANIRKGRWFYTVHRTHSLFFNALMVLILQSRRKWLFDRPSLASAGFCILRYPRGLRWRWLLSG